MHEPETTATEAESEEPTTPVRTLVLVWGALVAATALTVWLSRLDR